MRDRAATLVMGRRERLARALGRPLEQPPASSAPLAPEARRHLVDEAESLYWNEVEWEHLTDEEAVDGAPLAELAFPGLLALVRGLLLDRVQPDALAPAEPRPAVVDAILAFLAGRVLALEEELAGTELEDEDRLRGELAMTDRLVDLVLYRYHGLSDEDVERVEDTPPR